MSASRVELATGSVEGRLEDGVHCFRGIPYARPPTGSLRFRPPEPPEPWSGTRATVAFGAYAPQLPDPVQKRIWALGGPMEEDCLSLNVWTPGLDGAARPVMVWVHGGAFVLGSSSRGVSDGAALARRGDVVVVSLNYRLGALGWLELDALGDPELARSGNHGLLDQVEALRWVRDHVERFGGNPDDVTLFGESAGGISASVLLTAPDARGLFHKAIAQSGGPNLVRTVEQGRELAASFLAQTGTDDVEALRRLPLSDLLAAQAKVSAEAGDLAFGPVIHDPVLPETPLHAIAGGAARDVPLLTGTTLDEYRYWLMEDVGLETLEPRHLQAFLKRLGADDPETVIDANRRARSGLNENQLAIHLIGEAAFRLPAIRLAEAQARHRDDTRMYIFAWPSPVDGGRLGAAHAIEVPFVFGNLDVPNVPAFAGDAPERRELANAVQDAWVAFARTGDPSCVALPEWPAYAEARRATMWLDLPARVEKDPFAEARKAWGDARFDGLPA